MEDTQMTTIMDAINRIDSLKPNRYSQSDKVKWLSTLDERIMNDIIVTHEGTEVEAFNGYTDETSLTTELLVHSPYDEMYLYWLEAQIDYWNGEYAKYNNSIDMFNTSYEAFEKHYNGTHMPKGKKFKFF
jgi:hypothetical protein